MTLRHLLLPAFLMCALFACAQTSDFGTEYGASYSLKPWKGGELELSEELRLKDNSRRYAKSETAITIQHALLRKQLKAYDMRWRIGGGYSFINRMNESYCFSNQHRLILQSTISKDFDQLRLSFRTRFQSTIKNPYTGDYKDNPQSYLRLRISTRYNLRGTPWQIELSEEGFIKTFSPTGNYLDESRSILSATYNLDKHRSLTLYGKLSKELQTSNPETFYCLGLNFQFQ